MVYKPPKMPKVWYDNKENVAELAEFLVSTEQIESSDDLLDLFEYPERYNEVWNLYQKEILGQAGPPLNGITKPVRMPPYDHILPIFAAMATVSKT